jgi:uncharacterized protein
MADTSSAGARGALRLLGTLIIGTALVLGGYLAGRGVVEARLHDRAVTVKGVAEMEAKAALATFPMRFTVTGGDLLTVKTEIDRQAAVVRGWIEAKGFAPEEVTDGRLEVQDAASYGYNAEAATSATRYTLAYTLNLRTTKVDAVAPLAQEAGELVRQGILITDSGGPYYVFTAAQINEVKPQLIREATAAARIAADEFAQASGSRVGPIRTANQGVLSVLALDESPSAVEWQSVDKRIRAVTTVEYFLLGD